MIAATFQSLLQNFFTDHLLRQRQASPHTIAGYRDTFRLLFRFATDQLGKTPSTVSTEDCRPAFIGRFLGHLEQHRGNSTRTRNARLAAIHSFFRYIAVAEPAHASLCQQVLTMPSKRHPRPPIAFLDEAEIAAVLAAPDLSTWIGRRDRALLAVAIQTGLRVRRVFLEALHTAFETGHLRFGASLEHLRDRRAFGRYLAATRRTDWAVYAKPPFAGPRQVLDYVGRYTHRVAISNNRLVAIDEGRVTFRYKDYRANSAEKTLTLAADEFIRRFLLHVVPDGFQRIRYFGFLGNRHRHEQVSRCRALLGMAPASPPEVPTDRHDHYEALTHSSVRVCPKCHAAAMCVVEQLPRVAPRPATAPDTS